ncbi:hypothetical protein RFI_29270, partial [Reticulomyxa filosa]
CNYEILDDKRGYSTTLACMCFFVIEDMSKIDWVVKSSNNVEIKNFLLLSFITDNKNSRKTNKKHRNSQKFQILVKHKAARYLSFLLMKKNWGRFYSKVDLIEMFRLLKFSFFFTKDHLFVDKSIFHLEQCNFDQSDGQHASDAKQFFQQNNSNNLSIILIKLNVIFCNKSNNFSNKNFKINLTNICQKKKNVYLFFFLTNKIKVLTQKKTK